MINSHPVKMNSNEPKKNRHHIDTYIIPKNAENLSIIIRSYGYKPIVIPMEATRKEIEVSVEFTKQ